MKQKGGEGWRVILQNRKMNILFRFTACIARFICINICIAQKPCKILENSTLNFNEEVETTILYLKQQCIRKWFSTTNWWLGRGVF